MLVAVIHQRRHQHFGAIADAFDLELHEFVGALTQCLSGAHSLGFHQALDTLAQVAVGDADKAPWLHQADAWRLMRSFKQTRKQLRRYFALDEVPHVTALADGPVNRSALGVCESLVAHGANSAAAACGLEAK
ncbi:hypothetical protein D3C76_1021610 [compost metagenome]